MLVTVMNRMRDKPVRETNIAQAACSLWRIIEGEVHIHGGEGDPMMLPVADCPHIKGYVSHEMAAVLSMLPALVREYENLKSITKI